MQKRKRNKREEENDERKPKKKTRILKKIFIFLLIVLLAIIGFIVYKVQANGGGLQGLLLTVVGHDQETLKDLNPIQVLMMGVSTDNGGKLTDTIMVASYNPQTQSASLLSIPRDTFVGKSESTASAYDKINALYQKSPERTLEAVNSITGLEIKYYVVIDNQALIKLVDLIGGVEFEVPIDMDYDDTSQNLHIHLDKGLQTINGEKAEQLLRFRKNNNGTSYPSSYGDNDIGRMKTQRNFIVATIKQTLQPENILKIKGIIDIAYEYVETNLDLSIIKDYVPYAVNINPDNIKSASLPGAPKSMGPSNLSFYKLDKEATEELLEELYGSNEENSVDSSENNEVDNNTENSNTSNNTIPDDNNSNTTSNITKTEAGDIKIELINGSGSSSTLSEVKKDLTAKGYKISKTSTTTSTSKTTIINKTDVDEKFENDIKNILGVGNISSSSVSSSQVDITIIIGKDYK